MTLLSRLAMLEAVQVDAVERFQAQPFAVRRRLLDACAERLIRSGDLPDPDPDHPGIPLETLRRERPALFLRWHAETIATRRWFDTHK